MSEQFELEDLGSNTPELENIDDDDDTSEDDPGNIPIGEDYEDYEDTSNLIDPRTNSDRTFNILSSSNFNRNREIESIDKIFGDRATDAKRFQDFIDDIDKPNDYKNIRFIKYLMDTSDFNIKVIIYNTDLSKRYDIDYYGKPAYDQSFRKIMRPHRNYTIENGEFANSVEQSQFSTDIDYLYDKWKLEDIKKQIKRAGLVGGIIIAVAGLVTGLSLGLKRSGHSMVHDSKEKWKRLTPAEKKQIVIPWTELEKASGKGAIVVGDYLYVLIGGAILVYTLKK